LRWPATPHGDRNPDRRRQARKDDEGQAGIHRAYGADQLARLAVLKDRYDPGNLFHLNHNIPPTVRGEAGPGPG
jgi:Berberine and berberine like